MDFNERLKKFATSQGMSVLQMQTMLGYSNSYFRNMGVIRYNAAKKMQEMFPSVNVDWINTGRGEMLLSKSEAISSNTIPLLPVMAHGGSLVGFEDQVNNYECDKIISPLKEATLAITVTGDSMAPEYPSGSIVFMAKINDSIFIDWGRTYVLDTENGTIIKNVFPIKGDETKVVCHSINPNYPDFEVFKKDIRGWYRVLLQMALK